MRMRSLVLAVVATALPAFAADNLNTTALRIEELSLTNPGGGAHTLHGPTDLRFLPDGRIVITEKAGVVKIRALDSTVTVAYTFCVATTSEQGLLGVEVDPNFATTNRLFFYYSNCAADGGTDLDRHRVVSITLKADGTLDGSTEKILINNLRGPANHDGGGLAIGPDGKLYIGVGDTGCNVDCCPAANMFATCLSNGNGKIHRINLDGTIPTDNPLVGTAMVTACGDTCTDTVMASVGAAPRTSIWAWGTRNPFRFSFDKQTGNLWLGDVGEAAREEIDIVQKGKHHGYPWFEGFMGPSGNQYTLSQCNTITPGSGDCIQPLWDCSHGDGQGCQSITGGTFVDNPLFPAQYKGQYFFADNATGYFYVLHVNAARDGAQVITDGGNAREVLGNFSNPNNVFPCAIRLGNDGMPYYVMIDINDTSNGAGRIARVVPVSYDGGIGGAGGGSAGTGGGTAAAGGGTAAAGGGTAAAGGGTAAAGGGTAAAGGGAAAAGGGTAAAGGGTAATGGGTSGAGGGAAATGGGSPAAGGGSAISDSGTGGGSVATGGCNCATGIGFEQMGLAGLILVLARRRRRS